MATAASVETRRVPKLAEAARGRMFFMELLRGKVSSHGNVPGRRLRGKRNRKGLHEHEHPGCAPGADRGGGKTGVSGVDGAGCLFSCGNAALGQGGNPLLDQNLGEAETLGSMTPGQVEPLW